MYQSSYKSCDYYRCAKEVYRGERTLADVTAELNATTDENITDAEIAEAAAADKI